MHMCTHLHTHEHMNHSCRLLTLMHTCMHMYPQILKSRHPPTHSYSSTYIPWIHFSHRDTYIHIIWCMHTLLTQMHSIHTYTLTCSHPGTPCTPSHTCTFSHIPRDWQGFKPLPDFELKPPTCSAVIWRPVHLFMIKHQVRGCLPQTKACVQETGCSPLGVPSSWQRTEEA